MEETGYKETLLVSKKAVGSSGICSLLSHNVIQTSLPLSKEKLQGSKYESVKLFIKCH